MEQYVIKRDGSRQAVDSAKITAAVQRFTGGLKVSHSAVAEVAIGGLYGGATTRELDELAIHAAAARVTVHPDYARLAARIKAEYIHKEVYGAAGVASFSDSIAAAHQHGLVCDRLVELEKAFREEVERTIDHGRDWNFDYNGIITVYTKYLLKHPKTREVIERPQYWFMRVALALMGDLDDRGSFHHVAALYDAMSRLEYLPSTPTLFNAGTVHEQLSSCYLLDSPDDSLTGDQRLKEEDFLGLEPNQALDLHERESRRGIFGGYADMADLSKYAGGLGVAYSRVRGRDSYIRGTNGLSNGIVPWLVNMNACVRSVNQGGKRPGAAAVYLEPWHPDVMEFLELRDESGDQDSRAYRINLAHWIPDEFMRRVKNDEDWSLIDPSAAPDLPDLYGDEFTARYLELEAAGKAVKVIPARTVWARMMQTLAETGNGWMCFKDPSNKLCNQTGGKDRVVHSSNLCTEIIEVTDGDNIAVCNLGSPDLAAHVLPDRSDIDYEGLRKSARVALRQLDRVIDINFYPSPKARRSNMHWRPVGLGIMGVHRALQMLGVAMTDERAAEICAHAQEAIYLGALEASVALAEEFGACPGWQETRMAKDGLFHWERWGAKPREEWKSDWEDLRVKIALYGSRNSLTTASAPTATIGIIVGTSPCTEPQSSNLFKRERDVGDQIFLNDLLVADLERLGLWNQGIIDKLLAARGSVAGIDEIPDRLKKLYATAWEISMRTIIDLAAARAPFIDQSQSLNLWQATPEMGKMSSMYMYLWERGLKTSYYLFSRPATNISAAAQGAAQRTPVAVACSIDNPDACEACQ